MNYIHANAEGIDTMTIETVGNKVTSVVMLVPHKSAPYETTVEALQEDIDVFMHGPTATIENALALHFGGYNSVRLADGEEE